MSELKVNSIKGVGASSAAITVNNTDGTCTANITNNLSNRNLINNGAMQVAQRGTSSTVNGFGSIDRWQFNYGGHDNAITQSKINVAPTETGAGTAGFRNAFRITNGDQSSGFGTTDYFQFQQMIEDQNIANSGWIVNDSNSNITLSYWIRSSVAQEFFGFVETYHGDDWMYGWSTGVLTADTWTKITKTISGRSNLTWGNDNGNGLLVAPVTLWGTNYTDSSVGNDAWHQYFSSSRTPDATSTWWTTNGATVDITGVQVEVGSVATDFEHRSFAQELALCQRYFYMMVNASDGQKPVLTATCYTDGSLFGQRSFPVTMRANPSVYQVSSSAYYRAYGDNTSRTGDSVSISVPGTTGCELEMSVSGTSVSRPYFIRTNDSNARIGFSAEL